MENKYPWREDVEWTERTKTIAKLIHPYASVLDLGGGFQNLNKYLENAEYYSVDNFKCTKNTIVADFNKGEFPDYITDGEVDYIVCQGILEYIEDPERFLREIKKYGKILLITYRESEGTPIKRNNFDFSGIRFFLDKEGWEIVVEKKTDKTELLFICRQY